MSSSSPTPSSNTFEHTEADIILSVLPLAFSYGLYQLLTTFCQGGTLVLEESFAFPEAVLERMSAEHVTGFAGVPMIFSRLLTMSPLRFDLSALRYLTNAAAGLPVEHAKRLQQLFPRVKLYLMHGLTEVARTMYLPPVPGWGSAGFLRQGHAGDRALDCGRCWPASRAG